MALEHLLSPGTADEQADGKEALVPEQRFHRRNLEQLRKQARELLRKLRSGDAEALGRLSAQFPGRYIPQLAHALAVIARAVFAGYINGLHEAGWQGPVELVRLGYAAAIALRWTVLAGILKMLVHGVGPVRTSQGVLIPSDAALVQSVHLAQFLLDRADEARRLGMRWSGSYDA
jgi:hypothetical protein